MRLILRENTNYSNALNLNYRGYIQTVIVDAKTNKYLFSYENEGVLSDLVRKINFDVPKNGREYVKGDINVFLDVYQYNPDGEKIHFATVSPENPLTQEFGNQISSYPYTFSFADDFTISLIEETAMKEAISGGWSSVDLDIDDVASQIDELEGTIKISQQKIAAIRSAASETTLRSADVSGAESKFVDLIRDTGVIDVITTINDTYIKLAKYTKLSVELSKKAQAARSIYSSLTTYANIVDPVSEITIMAEKMFDNGEDAKQNGPTLVSDGVPTSIYYTKEEANPYEGGTMLRVYIVAPSKPLYSDNWWWYIPSENQVWQIDTDGFVVKTLNMEG
jgi:hypothetical protein